MLPRILWSSLFARRGHLVLALMAVTLGVAVTTALATLALQVGDDLARTLRGAGPNFVVLPVGARLPLDLGGAAVEPARAGFALPDSGVLALKRGFWKNAVLEAAPELSLAVAVEGRPVSLVGTWFRHGVPLEGETWRTGVATLQPNWKLEGRWPREDKGEIVLGGALARSLGLGPGRSASVAAGGHAESWLVTGIVEAGAGDERRAWAPLSMVQRLASREGQVDRIWLSALVKSTPEKRPPDPAGDPKGYERYMCTPYPSVVARDLAARFTGAEVLPMTEVVAGEAMVVRRLNLLMLLLALASLGASILGLFSTTTATVVERGVELGLLRSIGATSSQIAGLLLGETALVSLAGGILGWGLGTLGAAAIRGQTFGAVGTFPTLLLPVALVLSLIVAVLGTLGPLRMALRLDPAAVLRG